MKTEERILHIVSGVTDITIEQMKSKTRRREVVESRFMAMKLTRQEAYYLGLKAIGELYGNRDHSSVINAIKVHDDVLMLNPKHAAKYKECIRILAGTEKEIEDKMNWKRILEPYPKCYVNLMNGNGIPVVGILGSYEGHPAWLIKGIKPQSIDTYTHYCVIPEFK